MLISLYIILMLIALIFWFIMRMSNGDEEILEKLFFGVLAFIIFLMDALFTFGLTGLQGYEAEAIAYLLVIFSLESFLEVIVNCVRIFKLRNKKTGV